MSKKYAKDSMGDRMKDHEMRTQSYVGRKTYTILRLDGKAFHTFTKQFARPFDDVLVGAMNETCQHLCKNIQGAKLGFVQSDEITILITDFEDINTQLWYDGNIQKMVSISASEATAKFNHYMTCSIIEKEIKKWTEWNKQEDYKHRMDIIVGVDLAIQKMQLAKFDSRVFQVHSLAEARNNVLWRQQDSTRNSISAVAQSLYSPKELHGVNTDKMQEMIFQKGINWNNYDAGLKRGRFCYKQPFAVETEKGTSVRNRWVVEGTPIFSSEEGIAKFNSIVPEK